MISSIQGIEYYIKSMSTTMPDKCWWLDHIPQEINTIVDYGCAHGDLAIYLDTVCPGRFHYIGIDNSPEMLALARHNHKLHFNKDSRFFSELDGIQDKCDTSKAILVLNSVMHEIFSYLSVAEWVTLLDEMFRAGFAYIAVRDMCVPNEDSDFDPYLVDAAVYGSGYGGMWAEYNRYLDEASDSNDQSCEGRYFGIKMRIIEFLLKYRYVGNWNREMKETYLWNLEGGLSRSCKQHGYAIVYDERFSIPFVRDKIRTDFGIEFNVKTHRKLLYAKGDIHESE